MSERFKLVIIFEIVVKVFSESKSKNTDELKFGYLHNSLRSAKKEGLLSYSNKKLAKAIEKLIDVGFLIPQSDAKFTLATDYKEKSEEYFKKAKNSMDDSL